METLMGRVKESLRTPLPAAARDGSERQAAVAEAERRLREREAALEQEWRQLERMRAEAAQCEQEAERQLLRAREEDEARIRRVEHEAKAAIRKNEEDMEALLRQKEEEVARREEEAERKRRWLEEEKEAMRKLGAGPNDIIGLNLGGEKVVEVKRSLLLQFEGSMLAGMFSGRHDDALDRDKHGNVFLDYAPSVVSPLIAFLRLNRDLAPDPVPLPEIPHEDAMAWDAMINFLGLKDVFSRKPVTFCGVRENVPIAELHGWTLYFSKPYSHASSMDDFVPPDAALRGGALLVGARRAGSDVLSVAAMGNASVVTARRGAGATLHHNGTYWHWNPGNSVGFSFRNGWSSSPRCLTWRLDGSGGWCPSPPGETTRDPSAWEKVIFAAPFSLPDGAGRD